MRENRLCRTPHSEHRAFPSCHIRRWHKLEQLPYHDLQICAHSAPAVLPISAFGLRALRLSLDPMQADVASFQQTFRYREILGCGLLSCMLGRHYRKCRSRRKFSFSNKLHSVSATPGAKSSVSKPSCILSFCITPSMADCAAIMQGVL